MEEKWVKEKWFEEEFKPKANWLEEKLREEYGQKTAEKMLGQVVQLITTPFYHYKKEIKKEMTKEVYDLRNKLEPKIKEDYEKKVKLTEYIKNEKNIQNGTVHTVRDALELLNYRQLQVLKVKMEEIE